MTGPWSEQELVDLVSAAVELSSFELAVDEVGRDVVRRARVIELQTPS